MFKHYFELVHNVEIWPIISLSIFFAFFTSLLIWVFTSNKQLIKEMSLKPLEDSIESNNTITNNHSWNK